MPVVRSQRTVAPAPIPGVRRQAAETEISQGGAVARARQETQQQVARLGEGLAEQGLRLRAEQDVERQKAEQEEIERANRVAVLAAENRLDQQLNKDVFDPETGALAKRGPAAFDTPEAVAKNYDALAEELAQGLTNADQQEAFARVRLNKRDAMLHTLHTHVRNERETYTANELKANTENAKNTVILLAHQPDVAKRVLVDAEKNIRTVGKDLGMGPEQIEETVDAFQTQSISGAIQRLINEGRIDEARVYYNQYAQHLSGTDVAELKKQLDLGDRKKKSQQAADTIVSKPGSKPDEWRAAAKRISDAELREDTLALVEHEITFYERVQREESQKRMNRAASVVRSTGSTRTIPVSDLAQLDADQIKWLEDYAESRARGVEVKTQWPELYKLIRHAQRDPEGFAEVDLNDYISRISRSDLEQLAGAQSSIIDGTKKKALQVIDGFMTNQQIVDGVLSAAGFDPTPTPGSPQVELINKFREEVDRAVEAVQATTQKKATNEDVRTISRSLFRKVVIEGSRSWLLGSDKEKAMLDLPAAERISRTTLADMPPSLRKLAEDALRTRQVPVTPDEILKIYRRYLLDQLPKVQ